MTSLYYLTVTVHILAAVLWLGGMLFFALAAPVLRAVPDDATRAGLFDRLGRRFRSVGWACIAVLLVTGVGQLHFRGWWGDDFWGAPGFWATALGRALFWKLALVAVMLLVQAIHDFGIGPQAGRVRAGTPEAGALRRRAALLARLNAFAGLLLVYFAVRLARGG